MIWQFPTVENIIELQREQIHEFGGSHGLRDLGLLESAFHRAENKVAYEPDATAAQVAASVAWGLIKNHAFLDGNKRIGLVVLNAFLYANGHYLDVTADEAVAAVRSVRDERGRMDRLGRWKCSGSPLAARVGSTINRRCDQDGHRVRH